MGNFLGAAAMVQGALGFKHVQYLKLGPNASVQAMSMLMTGLKNGAMPKLQVLHLMANKQAGHIQTTTSNGWPTGSRHHTSSRSGSSCSLGAMRGRMASASLRKPS
jgi:hypothetical protein